MNDTVLVITVTNLTSLGVLDGFGNVRSYSTNFRVRHQTARAQDLTQLTNNAHGIRGCDNYVEVHLAFLDQIGQIVHTNQFSTGSFGSFSVGTLGEYGYAHFATGTVRQYSCTTYVLVGFTSIDTQVNGNVNAFNELGSSQFFQQGNGFVDGYSLVPSTFRE